MVHLSMPCMRMLPLHILQSTRRWWLVGALQAEAHALIAFPAAEPIADRYALIAAVTEAAASTAGVGVRRRLLRHTRLPHQHLFHQRFVFFKKEKRKD